MDFAWRVLKHLRLEGLSSVLGQFPIDTLQSPSTLNIIAVRKSSPCRGFFRLTRHVAAVAVTKDPHAAK